MEHLREYQDYLLAYRLRALVGGQVRPRGGYLSLAAYAQRRLRRQELAQALLKQADYRDTLREVERLTDELNFGFWHNPGESTEFLRQVVKRGGCRALESEAHFVEELLTPLERRTLSEAQARQVARYYLGLLRASASYLDAEVFTRLRSEIEPLRDALPLFVSAPGRDLESAGLGA